jgi:hypothetical protein
MFEPSPDDLDDARTRRRPRARPRRMVTSSPWLGAADPVSLGNEELELSPIDVPDPWWDRDVRLESGPDEPVTNPDVAMPGPTEEPGPDNPPSGPTGPGDGGEGEGQDETGDIDEDGGDGDGKGGGRGRGKNDSGLDPFVFHNIPTYHPPTDPPEPGPGDGPGEGPGNDPPTDPPGDPPPEDPNPSEWNPMEVDLVGAQATPAPSYKCTVTCYPLPEDHCKPQYVGHGVADSQYQACILADYMARNEMVKDKCDVDYCEENY